VESWTEHWKFKLLIDDNSAVDYNFMKLKFHHFLEPNAPFIKRIISNMFLNGLSMNIIGYSEDSSKNSNTPDIDIFMKKALGVAVFELEDSSLIDFIDWIEIDISQIPDNPISIGEEIVTYGSGFNIYSPEYFSLALDKGYISQILGYGESYLWSMTNTGASQCFPVWNLKDNSLIGIKLPVFINHNNMYTYSFILSLNWVVKSLTMGFVSIPKLIDDKFARYSKSIVKIRAGTHYGTGVFIHPAGYILTNRHVIEDSDTISINEEYDAKAVWVSTGLYDLALLKIIPTKRGNEERKEQKLPMFPILPVYTGNLNIEKEEDFYTTGYGLWTIIKAPAFSRGYVRKLIYHTDKQGVKRCQFISHSWDLYDGSSGGPLINSHGQIVGINFQNIKYHYFDKEKKAKTIIYSDLGFAIGYDVFMEIYFILFNNGLDEEEKHEFIQGHYCMSHKGEPLM